MAKIKSGRIPCLKKFKNVLGFVLATFMTATSFAQSSPGEIKGSVQQGLEQSSIMAENVLVEFDALEYKPVEIPGCYYEFALHLFFYMQLLPI